jgi:AraC-like DNA-binding protein
MLKTLFFEPKPHLSCSRVLGLLASQVPDQAQSLGIDFSVPAHTLLTFNVVVGGYLTHQQQVLPTSFVTGPHTRSRRYHISSDAILLTLFCRADATFDLCNQNIARLTNRWLTAQDVFRGWHQPTSQADPTSIAKSMLACVAPKHLPLVTSKKQLIKAEQLRHIMIALLKSPLSEVASQFDMTERSLQRLFSQQSGVSPKFVERLLRIQRCVKLWETRGIVNTSLADLALQVGLVDQAHLAREFRQLVGYPPKNLKPKSSAETDQYENDTLWALRTGSELLELLLK